MKCYRLQTLGATQQHQMGNGFNKILTRNGLKKILIEVTWKMLKDFMKF